MSIMRNSKMPAEWVHEAVRFNPFTRMQDGSFRTCPVRLAFCHILRPNPDAKNDDGTPKSTPLYEVTALCPPGAMEQINAVLWPEVYKTISREFPSNMNAQGQPFGLHCPPWRDQGEKQNYAGYTPGLPFMRFTTQYKPQIVDPGMNPIVEESRVYAGVWAILQFNTFVFGKAPPRPKKGVSLGLLSVMLIADDEKLSGGQPDVKAAFAGVKINARFDAATAMGAPAGSIMPPPTAVAPPPPTAVAPPPPGPPAPPGYGAAAPPPPPPSDHSPTLS